MQCAVEIVSVYKFSGSGARINAMKNGYKEPSCNVRWGEFQEEAFVAVK